MTMTYHRNANARFLTHADAAWCVHGVKVDASSCFQCGKMERSLTLGRQMISAGAVEADEPADSASRPPIRVLVESHVVPTLIPNADAVRFVCPDGTTVEVATDALKRGMLLLVRAAQGLDSPLVVDTTGIDPTPLPLTPGRIFVEPRGYTGNGCIACGTELCPDERGHCTRCLRREKGTPSAVAALAPLARMSEPLAFLDEDLLADDA